MSAGLYMRTKKRRNLYGPSNGQLLVIACVVLVIVMITLGAVFVLLYKPNHHAELPFDTDPAPIDTSIQVGPADTTNDPSVEVPIYTAREDVYNFLLIGHDKSAVLADVIMLINYDVPAGKVSVMQFPRDTYIDGGANVPKINVLFAAFYNRAVKSGDKNPTGVAAEQLTEILEQNLCLQIQYTAVMNLEGFVGIVDALGGVDIDVPYDMEYVDPEQNLVINIKAGPQHLDGKKAEGFVRFRSAYITADLGRVDAQKLFLAAFFNKVKSSISITNLSVISNLASEVVQNLTTDITVADVVYFGKNILSLDMSDITMMTAPGGDVKSDGTSYYVLNRKGMLTAVNKYFNIYDNDITDSIFDKRQIFNDSDALDIEEVYTAEKAPIGDPHKADEVWDNPIDIPLYPQ